MSWSGSRRPLSRFCSVKPTENKAAPMAQPLSLHRAGERIKGAILSRERMAPAFSHGCGRLCGTGAAGRQRRRRCTWYTPHFLSEERKRAVPVQKKGFYIGSLRLEELHALRNRVRCTWLRHESLRFVATRNHALLREARVTFAWRQTACGGRHCCARRLTGAKKDRVSGRFSLR